MEHSNEEPPLPLLDPFELVTIKTFSFWEYNFKKQRFSGMFNTVIHHFLRIWEPRTGAVI